MKNASFHLIMMSGMFEHLTVIYPFNRKSNEINNVMIRSVISLLYSVCGHCEVLELKYCSLWTSNLQDFVIRFPFFSISFLYVHWVIIIVMHKHLSLTYGYGKRGGVREILGCYYITHSYKLGYGQEKVLELKQFSLSNFKFSSNYNK